MPRSGWLAAGAIAAAVVGSAWSLPLGPLVAGSAAGLAVYCLLRRAALRWAALAGAAVLLRVAAGVALTPAEVSVPGTVRSDAWDHEAVVLSVNAPANGVQRAILELRPPDDRARVWASLPAYPVVVPTDTIRFGGTLEPSPTDSGFGDYLARSGIGYTTRARALERVGTDGSPLAELELLRRSAATAISTSLPEPQAGLAAAMSIGLRDLVPRDVANDFRVSGLSHVVAISGWHIAMLGAVVGAALGSVGRRPRSLVVLAAIIAYSIFAGASPSILRAAVMASVVLLARESGRSGSAAAGLCLTVAGMLVIDPATVNDIGFQLSVAATAGLLVWSARARDWIARRLPSRTPGWLLETLAISTAAQAATLPLILFHFASLSLVSPLANLLIAPLVAPAMLFTALALGAGAMVGLGVPAILLAPLSLIGSLVIGATIAIAHVCASLPLATVAVPEPFNLLAAAAASATLVAWLARRRHQPDPATTRTEHHRPSGLSRRFTAGLAVAAAAIVLIAASGARPDGRLHVTVLDVGQGDAIFLQGPNGGRALIDTGPDPGRLVSLLDQRIPAWDRRLDLVVITHPHEDHISGMAALLDRYEITEIVEPGMIGPGPGDEAFRQRLAETGKKSRIIAAGDHLTLDGIRMDALWPLPGTVPLRPPDSGSAINNVSIVLDVRFGARRIVLAGDVEQQIDPQLIAAGIAADGRPLDVLKVAHHGSGTATTDAFVERVKPRIAVVSAGWGNPYGHPSVATVARLEQNGAELYRTDLDGSIDISTNGSDLVANASGGRTRPPTPSPAAYVGVGFCPIPKAPAKAG
jgi:competence protein ComEC